MSQRLRVINLGLPKSGTTTLARALRRANLHVADHRIQPQQTAREDLHEVFVGDLLYRGLYHADDPLADLDEFDALSEISALRERHPIWPQTDWGLIEAIRACHPGVRFVATWRDPLELSNSMLAWTNMVARLERAAIPGLPVGYGETTAERVRWIEGHYATLERFFAGDPHFLHLPVGAEDARDRLAAFIGRDVPWWGQANRNTSPDLPEDDTARDDAARDDATDDDADGTEAETVRETDET
jgi:hypothetical protein